MVTETSRVVRVVLGVLQEVAERLGTQAMAVPVEALQVVRVLAEVAGAELAARRMSEAVAFGKVGDQVAAV